MQAAPPLSNDDLVTMPESSRTGKPADMFFAFAGVNLAVTNLGAGALGISLGLSLADVLLVYVIAGAFGAMTVAACVVKAKCTGASVMVNARPSFGYQGTRILAAIFFLITACWFGVNSFFGVTAARSIVKGLGGGSGTTIDLALLLGVILILVLIALTGYRGILGYEKLTVAGMGLAVMCVLVATLNHGVDWSYPASVSGGDRVAAIVVLISALGIGWGVSWTPYAHDFARHLRKSSSNSASFAWAWAGMFLGSAITFGLSAIIATQAKSAFDVGRTVDAVLPGGFAVVVLLVMTIGLLPANLANLLVGPAMLRTTDLPITRTQAIIVTALLGLPISVAGIYQPNFGGIFQGWMLSLIVIVVPWLVITLIDFFIVHRRAYSLRDLTSRGDGIRGGFFGPGIVAWLAGVLSAIAFGNTPVFTSPIVSMWFHGADLSIFIGAAVAAAIYYPWASRIQPKEPAELAPIDQAGTIQ